jgi:glutamate 5-kinase
MATMTKRLRTAKRVVIKIGSALLIDSKSGAVDGDWLTGLAQDIAQMKNSGQEVLIVSSGAIALGRKRMAFKSRSLKLEESQAAAAIGQIDLAHAYQEALQPHGLTIAQVLVTLGDTEERRRYLNARNTIDTLLGLGTMPVINENDTVATSEIRYGDNDRLAARVASMIGADCLVLLSDVDGLYTADPNHDADAQHIPEISAITPDIEKLAGKPPERSDANVGSGGMATKLVAGKIAVNAGCHMVIASGKENHAIDALLNGGRCSWFTAKENPRAARKQWIAGSLSPQGELYVDAGAATALRTGKSLLPSGVSKISGSFERGDAVLVVDADGLELARGLTAYSSTDTNKIIGHNSREIEERLGYRGRSELIHRDDLVLTETHQETEAAS